MSFIEYKNIIIDAGSNYDLVNEALNLALRDKQVSCRETDRGFNYEALILIAKERGFSMTKHWHLNTK